MWEVRTQWSRVNPNCGVEECEWSAVQVESQEEAEVWWNVRCAAQQRWRRVQTMWNPAGEVVRVRMQ